MAGWADVVSLLPPSSIFEGPANFLNPEVVAFETVDGVPILGVLRSVSQAMSTELQLAGHPGSQGAHKIWHVEDGGREEACVSRGAGREAKINTLCHPCHLLAGQCEADLRRRMRDGFEYVEQYFVW